MVVKGILLNTANVINTAMLFKTLYFFIYRKCVFTTWEKFYNSNIF